MEGDGGNKRVRKIRMGAAWHPERIERWLESQ